ncbi:hypothetical protein KA036_00540 [Candidatus Gracilibacteria bacterium]|jgi:hypothetical protein|nr:hypothetical protein [Candidatus Gracilibacteria bacterium]
MLFSLDRKIGIKFDLSLLYVLIGLALFSVVVVCVRDFLGGVVTTLLLALGLAGYAYFAKLNIRQLLVLVLGSLFVVTGLAKFGAVIFSQNQIWGVNLWFAVLLAILTVLVVNLAGYLAGLYFLKFPKQEPKESYLLFENQKKQKRYLELMFSNELVLFLVVFAALAVLAKFYIFALFFGVLIVFLRVLVLNRWEQLLMLISGVVAVPLLFLVTRLRMVDFRYTEILEFPLWTLPFFAIFVIAVYRLLISQTSTNEN